MQLTSKCSFQRNSTRLDQKGLNFYESKPRKLSRFPLQELCDEGIVFLSRSWWVEKRKRSGEGFWFAWDLFLNTAALQQLHRMVSLGALNENFDEPHGSVFHLRIQSYNDNCSDRELGSLYLQIVIPNCYFVFKIKFPCCIIGDKKDRSSSPPQSLQATTRLIGSTFLAAASFLN